MAIGHPLELKAVFLKAFCEGDFVFEKDLKGHFSKDC